MRLRLLIIVVVVSPARAGQALALGLIINSRPYHLPRRPTPLCRALCDPHIPSIRTAASSRAGAAGADLSNIRLVLPLPPPVRPNRPLTQSRPGRQAPSSAPRPPQPATPVSRRPHHSHLPCSADAPWSSDSRPSTSTGVGLLAPQRLASHPQESASRARHRPRKRARASASRRAARRRPPTLHAHEAPRHTATHGECMRLRLLGLHAAGCCRH